MRVLDLYCGAGGAAAGYARAGAEVIGVDIKRWNYPYGFMQMDALEFLSHLIDGGAWRDKHGSEWRISDFDLAHTSPPCQLYTAGNRAALDNRHPDLVDVTRQLLEETSIPWVIENVPGAPLRDPIELCGRMFGLGATDDDGTKLVLDRHRWFEASFDLRAPSECRPHRKDVQVAGVYGGARRDKIEAREIRGGGYVPPSLEVLRELMGINWMSERELFLAIPPVYTEWIYGEFLRSL